MDILKSNRKMGKSEKVKVGKTREKRIFVKSVKAKKILSPSGGEGTIYKGKMDI